MASIQERLNRLRGESSEASVYERLNHLRQIGQSQETESAAGGAGPAPAQRTVKSAPPAALPESKGKALTLPKAGERGFLAGGVSVEGSPFLYGSERAAAALLGAGEGVTDFIGSGFYKGVQGISSLGGLAPNPVSEWAGRNADAFLENSVTRDYEESIRERYRPSQGAENVTGIGQTIVQMLPGIGASKIVSAAGKGLNAAQAISRGENVGRALFGLQAAGNSASQAKAEGADTGQALAFGAASGALETAIEGIAGGIPGLGGGKVGQIAEAVKASPLVSRALDIAGEGGEEALSTVLTPYLQRAIYDPDAPNATPEEIAQSALMGAVAAGVLQGGLELPGTISDIYSTRRSIGSNAEITARAGERLSTPAYRDVADNPLATMLPTGEEALAGKRAYLPGSREYRGTASEGTKKTAPTEEAVNENGLTSLTERERINLSSGKKNKIVSTFKDAVSFVKNALINKQNTDRAYLGRVPDPVAQKIHEDTGLDLKGFGVMMNGDDVRHIMKNHGDAATERSRGQIAITPNDIARIPEILASPDRIYTSEEMDGKGRTAIIFEKQMGDYYITIQGISDGKQLLQTDTLYKRRTRTTRDTMLETQEGLAPVINAQGEPPQSSSNISILPGGQDVNLQQGDRGETQDTPREGPGPAFETGPESSVGAARKGFDPWSEFQGTRSEFFPEGANAARPVDVPTTDPQGRRIRKTASTAMGAKAIPDEVVGDIQNMVLRGELSYDRRSDLASTDRAVRTIEEKGYQRALEEFSAQVRKGVVSKDIATLGQQLLINAANAGDGKATAELLSLYAQMETTAGQAVQAASILRKLAPSDQLYAAKRVVSELEKTIQKNYKDLDITIDPSLIEEFNQQTAQAGRDEVLDKIYQNVADQVPAKWKDKWNAWRYMAMLFNPRTHIRNIVGNVGFQPLRWTKDRVAATIEAGVSKVSGGRLGRTKSFAANPALYKAAWADWANAQDVLSGNKYDDIRTEINSRRRIFRTAPLEAGRKINSWALEAEDAIFKRITYADALAGYLQSNGVTAEQMRNNTVDAQILSRARDYAGREALKATYQDRNMVSDKVVQIARALGPAGEAVLPFKRTPANILVRGMEYSPAGLAKALTYDLIQVKRGGMTGAEAIDHIASGLTGSGLMALGAYLFAQGIVTSGGGDDEGQDAINDLTGVQNYALNLPGGGNVTLDWLAPEALPFFMGVELMDSMGQGGNTAESISTALKSISDPMLELSMLQSLNDVIDSVSFSENKLGALVSSALVSYFTQPIPTFGGQIERSAEDVRMTTYTDKNLRLPTDLQYAIGRASARIPGWDYQQMPYIDAWGREDSSGPLWLRMANNFLNPAYTSNKQVTSVDEEIQMIYDQTGDKTVVPSRPERYITVDGERIDLSKEKYEQYATKRGQMQFEMLGNIIDNPTYRSMSDTDKAFVIDSVYEYADKTTKSEISSYRLDGWVKTAAQSDLSPEDYILFRAATVDIEGDKDENGKTIPGSKKKKVLNVIDQMNVSDEVKDKYYYAAGYDEDTISDAPWHGWGWW
nr:MAG TPA: nuclease [Caudoviricetes sp.]